MHDVKQCKGKKTRFHILYDLFFLCDKQLDYIRFHVEAKSLIGWDFQNILKIRILKINVGSADETAMMEGCHIFKMDE